VMGEIDTATAILAAVGLRRSDAPTKAHQPTKKAEATPRAQPQALSIADRLYKHLIPNRDKLERKPRR
jgi:hypothetical protein